MRTFWVTMALVLGSVPVAFAQPSPRFDVGPVVRVDRVMVESGLRTVMPVVGLVGSARFSKIWGMEGEITQASGSFSRSYEGWFVSYAPPNSTRAEIERLAPTARRTLGYVPGVGGSVAVTARGGSTGRADVVFTAGSGFPQLHGNLRPHHPDDSGRNQIPRASRPRACSPINASIAPAGGSSSVSKSRYGSCGS